eukprot:jgi/Ulvmu1/9510/UM052_0083.1
MWVCMHTWLPMWVCVRQQMPGSDASATAMQCWSGGRVQWCTGGFDGDLWRWWTEAAGTVVVERSWEWAGRLDGLLCVARLGDEPAEQAPIHSVVSKQCRARMSGFMP